MKKYDLSVYFEADYLCTGSFYDSFEYWYLLKQRYKEVGFIIVLPPEVRKAQIFMTIKDKYDIKIKDVWNDIYIFNRDEYIHQRHVIPIISKVLFIPSGSSAAQMYYNNVLISKEKVITILELPPDHEYMTTFNEHKKNVLMLYDSRVFKPIKNYECKNYRRALYFDIFKDINSESAKAYMVNMVTDHKCYEINELIDIMEHYKIRTKRWVIYTKEKWYEKYEKLESPTVKVLLTPHNGYMREFSTYLYLPSIRGFDPSPRLLAECKFYGKPIIYHNYGKAKHDGGWYRFKDVNSDWESLELQSDNEIIDIIEDWGGIKPPRC